VRLEAWTDFMMFVVEPENGIGPTLILSLGNSQFGGPRKYRPNATKTTSDASDLATPLLILEHVLLASSGWWNMSSRSRSFSSLIWECLIWTCTV
jgi:hypothetical protein